MLPKSLRQSLLPLSPLPSTSQPGVELSRGAVHTEETDAAHSKDAARSTGGADAAVGEDPRQPVSHAVIVTPTEVRHRESADIFKWLQFPGA